MPKLLPCTDIQPQIGRGALTASSPIHFAPAVAYKQAACGGGHGGYCNTAALVSNHRALVHASRSVSALSGAGKHMCMPVQPWPAHAASQDFHHSLA